jgi:predicted flap endonuclease-1-like 5' DNA nuclease
MTLLIGQMLGCLVVAAGIGVVVGWLLRQLSTGQLTQQSMDAAATLRLKEQMLEKMQHQLNVQSAEIQMLETKVIESEETNHAASRELSARHDRIQTLQEELAIRAQQLTALEAEGASVRRYVGESSPTVTAQSEETQQLHRTSEPTQQTLESNEEERHNLQRRITELEATVKEADQLQARVEELEAAQGRVHWLEVQLSDRDTDHRAVVHQLNSQLAERDRRIGELEPLTQRLREQEAALKQWETKYAHTATQHDVHLAKLQQQLVAQDQLQAQVLFDKQLLHERAKQIDDLQHRIQELEARRQGLADQVQTAGEKQVEIDRLRKRLVEAQAALRIKTDGGIVPPRQKTRQTGSQLSLLVEQAKAAKDGPKDDLSQIHGIGPVFARTLNKMGLHTFVQIASWKPEDIEKVAKKLYTAPDRIKRDNWINEAKRLHEQKYGQQL